MASKFIICENLKKESSKNYFSNYKAWLLREAKDTRFNVYYSGGNTIK